MSLDRLVKIEDRWDRLVEAASPALLALIQTVDASVRLDISEQEARFASYLPARPADEPHDAQCQVSRLSATHACTCKSNRTRRRLQVRAAAQANDHAFRETLGSMEQHAFDQVARPRFKCQACEDGQNPKAETDSSGDCLVCHTWVCPF